MYTYTYIFFVKLAINREINNPHKKLKCKQFGNHLQAQVGYNRRAFNGNKISLYATRNLKPETLNYIAVSCASLID